MKILITGDWQAKFSNLNFCDIAHKQELEIIEKYNVEVHIDLGDQKDDYNPIDGRVTSFCLRRSRAITKALKDGLSIRLLGNHDRYGQHADLNNWFDIFPKTNARNVDKPTTIQYKNVSFTCIPFRKNPADTAADAENEFKLLKTVKKDCEVNLLLFHNDVHGSRYDRIQRRESASKITLESLHTKAYTYCFGGHIHLRQQLSDNCMFAGNPFGTDMGEVNQEKGFILYDTETNKVKFIPSKVPSLYTWEYLQKNTKTKVIDGSKIKAEVLCDNTKNYFRQLDAVSSQIEKLYPNAVSFVLPKFVDATKQEASIVVDPTSSDYQKIKSYVLATVPSHLASSKNKLSAYMVSVLQQVSERSLSRATGKLTFGKVYAKNVLSFDKISYDFRKKGLVVVQGKNLDWPGHSNGAGKSNFLSMLPIAISAQTFKGQKNDEWANDNNNKKAVVSQTMYDEKGRKIKVIRSRRPTKLIMKIDGVDESTGLRSNGKRETQGQIEEFTGYNFSTLANSVYIDQRMSNAFLAGTPKERADLIHSFQNLERFVAARSVVSKELSRIKQNSEIFDSNIAVTESIISDIESEERVQRKKVKADLRKLRKELLSSKASLQRIERIQAKRVKNLAKRYEALDVEEDKIQSSIRLIEDKLVANSSQVSSKMQELQSLLLSKEKNCVVCFQPLTKSSLQNAKRLVAAQTLALEKHSKELETTRAKLKRQFQVVSKSKRYVDMKRSELDGALEKAEDAYKASKTAYESAKRIAKAPNKVDSTELDKRKILKRNIKKAARTLDHYAKEVKFLEYVIYAFSRDGLPSFLSNLLIAPLNSAASLYSKTFIDSEIQVVFEIEKGQITPKIINAHGGKSTKAQSMGEAAWAGLITSFALREIAQPSNLLILDEPGNGLDAESAKIFGSRLPRLKKHFETIIVVSHNQHILSALEGESTLTVVKKNKKSKLVQS